MNGFNRLRVYGYAGDAKPISRTSTFFCCWYPTLGILVFILSPDHGDPVIWLSGPGKRRNENTFILTLTHRWPELSRCSRFLPSVNSISVQLLQHIMELSENSSRSLARCWTGYPSSE